MLKAVAIFESGGGGGSGTVTSVSVVSANGFAGTVANPTTTPAITLSTTATGILSGDGTAISAYSEAAYTVLGNNTSSSTSPSAITSFILGSPGYSASGYDFAQWTANNNSYAQISLQNTNSTAGSSSDFVVTADTGNDTTNYVDLGINNSGGGAAPFTNALAGYLYTLTNELDIGALGNTGVVNFYTTGGTSPVLAASISDTQIMNFTNSPTMPTATAGDNTTKGASTAFVTNAVTTAAGNYFQIANNLDELSGFSNINTAQKSLNLKYHNVDVVTSTAQTGTYVNGTAGAGATFTFTATGTITINTVVLSLTGGYGGGPTTVLLIGNTTANGLYYVSSVTGGVGSNQTVLTRSPANDVSGTYMGAVYRIGSNTNGNPNTFYYYSGTSEPTLGSSSPTFTIQVFNVNEGGTNITAYTTGDTLYASTTNVLSRLAIGTSGQFLTVSGGVPAWSSALTPTAVSSISSNTNLAVNTIYFVTTSGSALSLTMPAPASGAMVYVKDISFNAQNNPITFLQHSSENLEGTAGSYVMDANGGAPVWISDGTNWYLFN